MTVGRKLLLNALRRITYFREGLMGLMKKANIGTKNGNQSMNRWKETWSKCSCCKACKCIAVPTWSTRLATAASLC